MQKNQKITLKVGEVRLYENWVSTMDTGDELALRYELKQAIKNVIERRKS